MGYKIIGKMLLKMIPAFLAAILFGVIGHLSIILISLVGIASFLQILNHQTINLTWLLLIFISLGIIRAVCRYLEQWFNHYVAFRLLADIRHHVFIKLRKLMPNILDVKNKGELINLISADVELLEVFFAHTITPIFIGIIISIIIVSLISQLSPQLGLITAISFIISGVIIPWLLNIYNFRLADKIRVNYDQLANLWYQIINGFNMIANFNCTDTFEKKVITSSEESAIDDGKMLIRTNILSSITSVIILTTLVISLIIGINLLKANVISSTVLIFILVVQFNSFGPLNSLCMLGTGLSNTISSSKRIINLLNKEESKLNQNYSYNYGDLNINNVSFGYTSDLVLSDVSAHINEGDTFILTGKNGSGKTTLLKLILGYYQTGRGTITLDNQDVSLIRPDQYTNKVSLMEQHPFFFNMSLRENFDLIKPGCHDEEIWQVLEKANIANTIRQRDEGLDYKITEESLSAGELQRLSLARMYLFDPDILLLDEPTSNLDVLNEGLMLESIDKYLNDKTVIIVSHKNITRKIANNGLNLCA